LVLGGRTLIESLLTGRYQRLALDNITNNNNSSKWELLKRGMPQGSILGLLFFLIYKKFINIKVGITRITII